MLSNTAIKNYYINPNCKKSQNHLRMHSIIVIKNYYGNFNCKNSRTTVRCAVIKKKYVYSYHDYCVRKDDADPNIILCHLFFSKSCSYRHFCRDIWCCTDGATNVSETASFMEKKWHK